MTFSDPVKRREYQRQWTAKRRSDWFHDKVCVRCGSSDDLQLDHIDPSTKVDHKVWNWSQTRREIELAKCQVLCADCHKVKTHMEDENRPKMAHGTDTMYSKGRCRCDECKLARKKAKAATRRKRKEAGLPYH